jgi:hypothetical protein
MRALLWLVTLLPEPLCHRILLYFMRIRDRELASLEVKLATTPDERLQAAHLLHDMYVRRRILTPHPWGLRLSPHLLQPTTVIFVAKENERVVATMALIVDSPSRLPMDEIYGEELRALRRSGRRLAEVGALCVMPGKRRKGIAFLLNKLMWRCARDLLAVDGLVIAVHPAVRELYRATLLFRTVGEERSYPGLNRCAIAVALHLDLRLSVWNLKRRWGGLGPHPHNPFHLYVERQHPQLRMPRREDLDAAASTQRRIAAAFGAPAFVEPERTRAAGSAR